MQPSYLREVAAVLVTGSWWVLAIYLDFLANGSDTGSRGSSPLNFAEKTGISLTFSQVQLTIRKSAQNFDHLFFACLKGEFNPHFRAFFGTNWDKLARGYDPHSFAGSFKAWRE